MFLLLARLARPHNAAITKVVWADGVVLIALLIALLIGGLVHAWAPTTTPTTAN